MSRMQGGVWGVLAVLVGVAVVPEAQAAEEVVFQFRTQEDAATPPDPTVCAAAPFAANVRLGARVYLPVHRRRDRQVVEEGRRAVGMATACVQLVDFRFPPGQQVPFYARFSLPDGDFTALGTCTLVSNDVPEAGLVLAGCALRLVEAPEGFTGGTVSSTSVFNPFRLPGYATGSYYTLYAYRAPGWPALQWEEVEDGEEP